MFICKQLTLWNTKTGEQIVNFYQAENPVFTLDNKYLLYVDSGQTIISYCLSKMAPLRFVSCPAGQLLVVPVCHRLVVATCWSSSPPPPVPHSASSAAATSNTLFPPSFQNNNHNSPSINSAPAASPEVFVWDFVEGRKVATLEYVAPSGIKDMSKDGRIAVDGYLQVYDVKTGRMLVDLGDADDENKEFSFVRLTYDGLYVVWIDKVSVKAKRVSDGVLVANISTHERPTSLVTLDYGYILVVGRDDGRVLVMKLIPNAGSDVTETSQFVFRPDTVLSRTQSLLDRQTCDIQTLTNLDPSLVGSGIHEVRDSDMTHASDHIRSVLLQRARMPLVMTGAATTDKYRRCQSTTPLSADIFHRGMPITPMTAGSGLDVRPCLLMDGGDVKGRSGSTPCLEIGGSTGELTDIDATPDSTPPMTAASAVGDSPPLLIDPNAAPFNKRMSRSLTNMAAFTLPTRGKNIDNKHRHRLMFNNTPRHRKPLPPNLDDSAAADGSHAVLSDLPPRPSAGTTGRRGLINMILDLPATIREKRRRSKQRCQSNSSENRDRMPSV